MITIKPAYRPSKPPKKRTKTIIPSRRRGRPANPLPDVITVSHPIHRHIYDKRLSIELVMRWTGRSESTVRRWAKSGKCPDIAVERLLQIYAFGMPPIPPELYRHPCCERWALMGFGLDKSRPIWRKTDKPEDRFQWVIWTDRQGYNVQQVSNTVWLSRHAKEALSLQRAAEERADKAEKRLRDLTHYLGYCVWR